MYVQQTLTILCGAPNFGGDFGGGIPQVSECVTSCVMMTLQHTATRCNTLQHTATHCNIDPASLRVCHIMCQIIKTKHIHT